MDKRAPCVSQLSLSIEVSLRDEPEATTKQGMFFKDIIMPAKAASPVLLSDNEAAACLLLNQTRNCAAHVVAEDPGPEAEKGEWWYSGSAATAAYAGKLEAGALKHDQRSGANTTTKLLMDELVQLEK